MKSIKLFAERQRFTQWWVWAILIGLNILFLTGMVLQVFLGHVFGNKPAEDGWLILIFGFSVLMTAAFFSFRLEMEVTPDGVGVRFFPFTGKFKKYQWQELQRLYVRKYDPIIEYGGWGLRYSSGYGEAMTVGGDHGLQLEFRNGRKLLIGTKQPDVLLNVLKQFSVPGLSEEIITK